MAGRLVGTALQSNSLPEVEPKAPIGGEKADEDEHLKRVRLTVPTDDDRIKAMARAHDLITADRWGPARLADMLETETAAYLGAKRQRVPLTGPIF